MGKYDTGFATVHRSGIVLETEYLSDSHPLALLDYSARFGLQTVKTSQAGLLDGQHESGAGVRNLLRLWALATDDQVERGLGWYPRVHDLCVDLGNHYGFSVNRVAGAIAATSPQISWEYNVVCAALACRCAAEGGDVTRAKIGQTYTNRRKAVAYLHGELFDGPKANSFVDNIAHPSKSRRVTIDTHAIGGYAGVCIRNPQFDSARYHLPESAYQSVAHTVGELPCAVQAVIWLVWRETVKGYAPDSPIDANEAIERALEYPI